MINFEKALKKLRKHKHLTQAQVAEKMGIAVTDYSRIERGDVRIRQPKLDRFLKAIDATDTEFLLMCIGKDITEKERGMLYDILTGD